MNKNLITLLIIAATIISCQRNLEPISDNEVPQETLVLAKSFAKVYLSQNKKGESYIFDKKSTRVLANKLTAKVQKSSYQDIIMHYGEYISWSYKETWISRNENLKIVRFMGNFEQNKNIEIRVVINKNNKICGFWIKPWKDQLIAASQ